MMELCSGAGGTSFVCQDAEMNGKRINLEPKWAFDIESSACAAYQINDPRCHVYALGIDEALMLSRIWETEVVQKWGPEAPCFTNEMRTRSKVWHVLRILLVQEQGQGLSFGCVKIKTLFQ